MEQIEYEERVLIPEDIYLRIIEDAKKDGKPFSHIKIENVYLDNDERFIYKTKKMLRIRNINGSFQELTLKIKNPDGSNREINETLKCHPVIDKQLSNQFETYHPTTKLLTDRIEVQYDEYLLVIDKNEYEDIIDFDIEIEAKSQQKALEVIQKYCGKYHLKYDENYHTKSHRAFKRMEELKKKKGD